MTPSEWKDWIIGGQESVVDNQDNNLHLATAFGLVQGGKKLKRMAKENEAKRREIRGELEEYKQEQHRKRIQNRRIREGQKRATARFLQGMQNTSHKRG